MITQKLSKLEPSLRRERLSSSFADFFKLKVIKDAKPPTDIKTMRSFVGLCNFFRTHIKDFALIAAPLFKLTRKDSGYKSGPLPEKALKAFFILQKQLTSEPVMAF